MKNEKYKISKSTVECYKLRHPSGIYWADITVDAAGEQGRIQIASEFGDWQYFWSSCGVPFKTFLEGLEMDYVARKFGAKDHFDAEYNIKRLKNYVIELRREESIYFETARKIWDELISIEEECTDDVNHFYHLINSTDNLFALYYDGFDICKTYNPGFKQFWKKVWKAFVEELKRESLTPKTT